MADNYKMDTVTLKATAEITEKIAYLFEKLGDNAGIAKDRLKEILEESTNVNTALEKVDGPMNEFGKYASLAKDIIRDINKEVEHMKDGVDLVDKGWQRTAASIGNASKALDAFQKATHTVGGEAGDAALKLGQGLFDIATGIGKGAAGIGDILGGLVKIGQVLDGMDKYWAKTNRAVYDTNAALGKMGEYSTDLVGLATTLGLKYVKNFQEVEKLLHSVAQVGVSYEHIAQVTDDILDLSTRWSAMTPDKQIKMMSDYMKDFGLSSVNAHNVIKGLLLTAEELKKTNRELDIQQYIDQVSQVSLATRRLNFEWGDAAKYVDVMVRHLGTAPDVLKRAAEFTQAMMQYGQQDLGMQVYMMDRMGVKGDVFTKLGTWTTDTDVRMKGQVKVFKEMVEDIGRGGGINAPMEKMTEQQLAGIMKVGGFGGVLPGMDEVTIAKIVKEGGVGLTNLLEKMYTAERQSAEDQKQLPGNIAEITKKTTAHTDFFKLWTDKEFYTRTTTGYAAADIIEKAGKGERIDTAFYEKYDPKGMGGIKDVMRLMETRGVREEEFAGYDPKQIQAAIAVEKQKSASVESDVLRIGKDMEKELWRMGREGTLTGEAVTKLGASALGSQTILHEDELAARSNIGRLFKVHTTITEETPASPGSVTSGKGS